ncbi:roadblock/LC7 domain-containing protein [Loktanella agnita]|uniref:roadblock/LC7 domain-containing protein n=1 Tax=Loktanella agnita TaxID=287097 RepID=UPI0039871BEB
MAIDISGLSDIGGFIGACMVDSETGLMMASEGGGKFDLEAAGAANTEVVKAKLSAIEMLDLDDHIDDILITLGKQFHLIRPLEKSPKVFLYVALDKKAANLGMARVQVKKVEQSISL